VLPPDDWPHRQHSRSLKVGAVDWHLQMAGNGPLVLLMHGSGASAHSWSEMLPLLARHATVLAPDLPGHGFTTGAPFDDLTLPRLRELLAALLGALKLGHPALLVGHSAGAALALRWAVDAPRPPKAVLGFAPSLVAPPARLMQWMAPLVQPFATSLPVTRLLATFAGPTGFVDMLLDSTGSRLPKSQRAAYRRLFGNADHVRGAMSFMAAADLPSLLPACSSLPCAAHFVLGDKDRWIPERPLRAVLDAHLPLAEVQCWPGGHLVHEETPQLAAQRVLDLLAE
jgi:magnesium chelatase accessory protein